MPPKPEWAVPEGPWRRAPVREEGEAPLFWEHGSVWHLPAPTTCRPAVPWEEWSDPHLFYDTGNPPDSDCGGRVREEADLGRGDLPDDICDRRLRGAAVDIREEPRGRNQGEEVRIHVVGSAYEKNRVCLDRRRAICGAADNPLRIPVVGAEHSPNLCFDHLFRQHLPHFVPN